MLRGSVIKIPFLLQYKVIPEEEVEKREEDWGSRVEGAREGGRGKGEVKRWTWARAKIEADVSCVRGDDDDDEEEEEGGGGEEEEEGEGYKTMLYVDSYERLDKNNYPDKCEMPVGTVLPSNFILDSPPLHPSPPSPSTPPPSPTPFHYESPACKADMAEGSAEEEQSSTAAPASPPADLRTLNTQLSPPYHHQPHLQPPRLQHLQHPNMLATAVPPRHSHSMLSHQVKTEAELDASYDVPLNLKSEQPRHLLSKSGDRMTLERQFSSRSLLDRAKKGEDSS
uniref:Uncharacterized protein n=1 Tax=Vespula pensylvanica TaxID=30213 RepID=A0A834KCL3_VESPE|nr:hypothetical protein H0235_014980 [Vespula pensylvanica]